jgi:O-6-methylguanine DNA methyltransferase
MSLARTPSSAADQWVEIPGDRVGLDSGVYAAIGADGIRFVAPSLDAAEFAIAYREFCGGMVEPGDADDYAEEISAIVNGENAAELCDLGSVTTFTRRVLEATCEIRRGETRSYQWLARRIGMPEAARAVGNALGSNPLPLVIPCHRIVRGDGSIGGYAFGSRMKQALLETEGVALASA